MPAAWHRHRQTCPPLTQLTPATSRLPLPLPRQLLLVLLVLALAGHRGTTPGAAAAASSGKWRRPLPPGRLSAVSRWRSDSPARRSPPREEAHPAAPDAHWCRGLLDGLHADLLALPPCSGFFRCERGLLRGLFACPLGQRFNDAEAQCVAPNRSSCAAAARASPTPPGSSPPLEQLRGWQTFHWRRRLQRRNFLGIHVDYRRALGAPPNVSAVGPQGLEAQARDFQALLAFKAANLDPQNVLASWQPSRAGVQALGRAVFCKGWYGVTCNARHRVVELNLRNFDDNNSQSKGQSLWGDPSINQSIPPEFGNLTELEYLDLSHNFDSTYFVGGLVGPIPPTLGLCSRLSHLDLSYNNLEGSLPGSLGQLTALRVLQLSTNLFTGPLPAALSALSNLTLLDASYNNLTGSLPAQLGLLGQLQVLTLSWNQEIQGSIPESWGKLASLNELSLSFHNLTGPLPDFWAGLPLLCSLTISTTHVSGSVPASLGSVGTLCPVDSYLTIDLSYNKLSGPLTPALLEGLCSPQRASPLLSLDAHGNKLNGTLPLSLANCSGISTIDLSGNELAGPLLPGSTLAQLKELSILQLGSNRLTGSIPTELVALPSLGLLNLSANGLSGPCPAFTCNSSSKLSTVAVSGNGLSGSLSSIMGPSILDCQDLQQVDLSQNRLTGDIPKHLFNLSGGSENTVTLLLQDNLLTGALPALGPDVACTALRSLNASGNQLQGSVPESLSRCSALVVLDLSRNQMLGPFPSSLGTLTNLLYLSLGHNQLYGSFPQEFATGLRQLTTLDVSRNMLFGSVSSGISDLKQLVALDLSWNALSGTIPSTLTVLRSLNALSLAGNSLSGSVPQVLIPQNLPNLRSLDLSSNDLAGPIPFGYANVTAFPWLRVDFSSNNLSGQVPGQLAATPQAVQGNPGLCGGAGYPPCPQEETGGSGLSTGVIVGIAVGAAAALVVLLGVLWWFLRPTDEWAGGNMLVFEKLDFALSGKDILDMTDNFSPKYLLGAGGFGTVYKATLPDGRMVAIKRLKEGSSQGNKEFEAEISSLGNIRHRNLVTLIAAYVAAPPSKERVLVYDFMPGGSLDHILDSEKGMEGDSPFRSWSVRRNIALDVARGLQYLHHDCQPRIIHRDMKPANVLLDDQLVGHVADFGLARQADASKTHMSTAVYGTVGYLALEYVRDGRLSFKSDVYAFGVTLLQIITGRRPTDKDISERGLSRWVSCQSADQVVDQRMILSDDDLLQIQGAIKLGLLCTSKVPVDRPSMNEVYHLLGHLDSFGDVSSGESN